MIRAILDGTIVFIFLMDGNYSFVETRVRYDIVYVEFTRGLEIIYAYANRHCIGDNIGSNVSEFIIVVFPDDVVIHLIDIG
jgi:hypothetical protein